MAFIANFDKKFGSLFYFWKIFRIYEIFIDISIMSKVFTDFFKMNGMNKGIIIGIPIAIVVVVLVVAGIISNLDTDKMEVEDTLDKEIIPEDNSEIDKKIEEIEKIKNENEYEVLPREWKTSGPFQIDRNQYALGEKIFLRIGGLKFEDKGQVAVMRPLNSTHYGVYLTIPFDGAQKPAFNYYLDPQLSKTRGLCSVDDVLGNWTLVFRGTNYPNLYFEIVNKTVPGTNWDPVC